MVDLNNEKKKVMLIGATGGVGMATQDAIRQYLGADIYTYDRPIRTEDQRLERERRVKNYNLYVQKQDELLDGHQAQWLLRDYQKLPENKWGAVHSIAASSQKEAILEAFNQGVRCIAIAAGAPRKDGEDRDAVIDKNSPFYSSIGQDLALALVEKIKEEVANGVPREKGFKLPVVIVGGNPLDPMTETLGRIMFEAVAQLAIEARNAGNAELAKRLERAELERPNDKDLPAKLTQEARTSGDLEIAGRLAAAARELENKIVGQSGILDGARAAVALAKKTDIPLKNIDEVMVTGTHNDLMQVDLANAIVVHNGKKIFLKDYPDLDISSIREEVEKGARKGGAAVIKDYQEKLQIPDQTAVLATGAAMMQMVDACIHEAKILPAAIYSKQSTAPETGRATKYRREPLKKVRNSEGEECLVENHDRGREAVVMGQIIKLGVDGVTGIIPYNPELITDLHSARLAAQEAVNRALGLGGSLAL